MLTRRRFLELSCTGIGSALAGPEALTATWPAQRLSQEHLPSQNEADVVAACRDVLTRQIGPRSSEFDLHLVPSRDGKQQFEVSASGGRVSISGSNGISLCRGAYHYLRTACNAMITWSGQNLDLPQRLPDLHSQNVLSPYRFVQFYNPCTFGYSMPFWDWPRWEREIDWLALHGVNMPLALEGQEAIWNRIWRWLGLSQAEIDAFSVGPAHLPWHRMGNINNFQGPLPESFIEGKRVVQKKILSRMISLGMTPVVPAFSGFVPQGFKRLYPDARTSTLLWADHATLPRNTRTFILHPGEQELYHKIGQRFIEEYRAEYGSAHYYLADAFNELRPPVSQTQREQDLEQFGRTIYESILAGDPEGNWVMQGWLFVNDPEFWDNASVAALLRGIPNERMLILDFANDADPANKEAGSANQWKRQKAFFGKQWVNGMIHTFGGNNNVKGNLELIATAPVAVLDSNERGNLVGWGMCPEGTQNNEVAYELMTDMGWVDNPIDLSKWIPDYCRARYGSCPEEMVEAWQLFIQSAYRTQPWRSRQAWQRGPSDEPVALNVDGGETFRRAVNRFLDCAPEMATRQLYRNDLIEFVVQAAGASVDQAYALAVQAFREKQNATAMRYASCAKSWLLRMDALMNLRPDRRLETWVQEARAYANSADEAAYYDENARQLITTWGWPDLSDYAARVWSGLIRDYYAPRWAAWFDSLGSGQPFSTEIWELTWLSSPYHPSMPSKVPDLIGEARALLADTGQWQLAAEGEALPKRSAS